MRWILLFVLLIANAAVVLQAAGPSFVTRVPAVPDGVTCNACSTPEVRAALIASAESGRSELYGSFNKIAMWAAVVGALNLGVIGFLLFRPRRHKV